MKINRRHVEPILLVVLILFLFVALPTLSGLAAYWGGRNPFEAALERIGGTIFVVVMLVVTGVFFIET